MNSRLLLVNFPREFNRMQTFFFLHLLCVVIWGGEGGEAVVGSHKKMTLFEHDLN